MQWIYLRPWLEEGDLYPVLLPELLDVLSNDALQLHPLPILPPGFIPIFIFLADNPLD